MDFLVKVKAPNSLWQKDIIKELNKGLHLIIGGGDPNCPYLKDLEQVKVVKIVNRKRSRV